MNKEHGTSSLRARLPGAIVEIVIVNRFIGAYDTLKSTKYIAHTKGTRYSQYEASSSLYLNTRRLRVRVCL